MRGKVWETWGAETCCLRIEKIRGTYGHVTPPPLDATCNVEVTIKPQLLAVS